jgi:putative transposase
MRYPAERYVPSTRPYRGLPEIDYPFHDRTVTVTTCGRICFNRQKINLSTVFAGQSVGIKQVSEHIGSSASWTTISATLTTKHAVLEPLENSFHRNYRRPDMNDQSASNFFGSTPAE